MSATKDFLANPANYSESTKRGLCDERVSDIISRIVIRNPMVCADGFRMSVQYSTGHYCNGRERFLGGDMESYDDPYPEPRSVEIGFPSEEEPMIAAWAEEAARPKWVKRDWYPRHWDDPAKDWHSKPVANRVYDDLKYGDRLERWLVERFWPMVSNLTNTVYGWVPVEVVDEVIAKHGGLANGQAE